MGLRCAQATLLPGCSAYFIGKRSVIELSAVLGDGGVESLECSSSTVFSHLSSWCLKESVTTPLKR